jgi:hypothetical protein
METTLLAAFILSRVKNHVPGCGGPSQMLSMRNNGTVDVIDSFPLDRLTESFDTYDQSARELLISAADHRIGDPEFEERIDEFANFVRHLHMDCIRRQGLWTKDAIAVWSNANSS